LARHENFVEQISIKCGGFYLTRWIWFKLCCRQAHQNISGKCVYRPIFKRSNIGGPIYINWSLCQINIFVKLLEQNKKKKTCTCPNL